MTVPVVINFLLEYGISKRKTRSPFWWCFYREDGSRSQRSTRLLATQANRWAAQRMADDLGDAHQKKATEGQMRRILTDLNERLVGQPLASATLEDCAAQWLARKKGEIGGVTYLAYKSALSEFVDETPSKANLGLQSRVDRSPGPTSKKLLTVATDE